MKKTCKSGLLALALSYVAGAAGATTPEVPVHRQDMTVMAVTTSATDDLSHLIRQTDFAAELHRALQQSERGIVPLQAVMARFDPSARTAVGARLTQAGLRLRELKGLPLDGASLLQARLVLPDGATLDDFAPQDLRVAATPVGDDKTWKTVRTYGGDGSVRSVDAEARPAFPLVMIEVDVRTALREGMEVVNEGLRANGLQAPDRPHDDPLDITRLDYIYLFEDQEPSIKGAAEIFAIASGLQVDEKKPQMRTFEMPWLDYDMTGYYPRQDWIHWGNYRYDVANVQMFEEDGNTNYKAMLQALIKVISVTVGPIEPTVGMVSLIADEILKVLPDAWFIDDHDYVDSYYLLGRGEREYMRLGAAGNATVDLEPITLGN